MQQTGKESIRVWFVRMCTVYRGKRRVRTVSPRQTGRTRPLIAAETQKVELVTNAAASANFFEGPYKKLSGRLIFKSNKKTFRNTSVLCTPPFENSLIKSHRFCVLPPLKNHSSKAIGFVYSPLWKLTHQKPSVLCTPPLWKITHQKPLVLCTPPFEKITVFGGRLFRGGRDQRTKFHCGFFKSIMWF